MEGTTVRWLYSCGGDRYGGDGCGRVVSGEEACGGDGSPPRRSMHTKYRVTCTNISECSCTKDATFCNAVSSGAMEAERQLYMWRR